jgi:hypothetical protein
MGGYHVSVPESRNNEEELAGSREPNYKQRGPKYDPLDRGSREISGAQ